MTTSSTPAPRSALEGKLFAPLAGLTSLAILCQAITAGQFVSQEDRDGWIAAHNVIGLLTVLCSHWPPLSSRSSCSAVDHRSSCGPPSRSPSLPSFRW